MRQVRVEQTRSLHDADIRGVIVMLRRQKVLLDADLARLYGVSTKRLNEQVRRNLERFPPDFMFQHTNQ
jgi:ORF6N domain-containing protein